MAIALSGSLILSGSIIVSGSIISTGTISMSGSIASASYASNAELLDGLDSTVFTLTSSFNAQTASFAAFTSSLNSFSASVLTFSASILSYTASQNILNGTYTLTSSFVAQTASFNAFSASVLATTASLNSFSSSVLTFTGSAATRLGALESATASLNSYTSSNTANITSLNSYTSSATLRFVGLETATASFSGRVGGLEAATASLNTYTSSATARFVGLETYTSSINAKTGSFATTGSNIFIGTQTITGSIVQSGSFTTTGTIIAQSINVQQVTSSVVYSCGSNIFGNNISNTQVFSGSLYQTGSLACFAGTVCASTIIGTGQICSTMVNASCIGIGTTTPGVSLDVNGSGIRITNSTAPNIYLNNAVVQWKSYIVSNTTHHLAFSDAVRDVLTLGYNGASSYFQGGVVGVNTNAAVTNDGNFVVAGCIGTGQGAANTTAQINIWETVSGNKSGLWFGSMTNANTGVIGSRTATGNIAFQTYCGEWAERMRITYNGNVGIGTTSPSYKLDIQNGSDFDIRLKDTSLGGTVGILLESNNDFSGTSQAYIKAILGSGNGQSSLIFGTATNVGDTTASEKMRITPAGIACFACQICAPTVYISTSSTGGIAFNIDRTLSCAGYFQNMSIAGSQKQYSYWNGSFVEFGTGMGIFTCQVCAPSFVLANGNCITALRSTGGAAIGVLGFTSGTDTLFIKGGTSGAAASIQFQDTGGTIATFYDSKLGIGTTSPCASLHIVPTASNSLIFPVIINNQVNCATAGYGVGLRLQNSSMAGTQEINKWAGIAAIAGGSSGYSNDTDLAFYVGCFILAANCTCPPVEKMRIQSSTGYVGIGTTSPCAVLHVQGTAALQDLLYFCTGASVNTKFVYNIASGADDAFILRRNHTTQGNLCIMSWTYNGYVGIGTTSPSEKLTVYGAVIRLEGAAGVCAFAIANNNSSGFRIYDYNAGVNRMTIANTGVTTFACQICAPQIVQSQDQGKTVTVIRQADVNPGTTAYMAVNMGEFAVGTYRLLVDMSAGAYGNSLTGPGVFKASFGGYYDTAGDGLNCIYVNNMTNGSWAWGRSGCTYCIAVTNTGAGAKFAVAKFDITWG